MYYTNDYQTSTVVNNLDIYKGRLNEIANSIDEEVCSFMNIPGVMDKYNILIDTCNKLGEYIEEIKNSFQMDYINEINQQQTEAE